MGRRARALRAVLLAVLLTGTTACGSDDGSDGGGAEDGDTTPTEAATDDDGGDEQRTFADEFMEQVGEQGEPADDGGYAGYVEVSDDTGALFVEVPTELTDVLGEPDADGEPRVDAATDLDAFFDGWDTSGVSYRSLGAATLGYSSSEEAYDDLIGATDAADACRFEDRRTFTESELDFTVGFYADCGEPSSEAGEVFVFIDDDLPILHLTYVLTRPADDDAFQEVLATFGYDSSRL